VDGALDAGRNPLHFDQNVHPRVNLESDDRPDIRLSVRDLVLHDLSVNLTDQLEAYPAEHRRELARIGHAGRQLGTDLETVFPRRRAFPIQMRGDTPGTYVGPEPQDEIVRRKPSIRRVIDTIVQRAIEHEQATRVFDFAPCRVEIVHARLELDFAGWAAHPTIAAITALVSLRSANTA
jgi:hypothetical protein